MPRVTLTFNNAEGDPEMRAGYVVPGSAPVHRMDGSSVPADQIEVGSFVRIFDGSYRRVDQVEIE